MPVNSFESYPMSWKPNRDELQKPYYEAIASALEQDIVSGKLPPNTKLPPQRELADYLDLNLSTITRAYKSCELKGLIYATTGKGSFVSPNIYSQNVLLRDQNTIKVIELGTVEPFYQLNHLVMKAAHKVIEKSSAINLLEYMQPWDNRYHLSAAKHWLEKFHVKVSLDNILITSGGQNALTVTLISLFQPGDKIATDPYTYPNFIGLANLLHIQLIPVENDKHGMLPDSLEHICKTTNIKGIYLMPSCSNPTTITMPMERREKIAEIIKQNGLTLIEDDTYSFLLPDGYTPFYSMIPEQTIYICGTSKSLCAGLRVAFMAYPNHFRSTLINGAYNTNLKTAAINTEIIVELINSGLADKIIEAKRELAVERNRIYLQLFSDAKFCNEATFFQWYQLPNDIDGREIELLAESYGVRILCSQKFSVGSTEKNSYIRLAICSPKETEELERGLSIIQKTIHIQSDNKQNFIV